MHTTVGLSILALLPACAQPVRIADTGAAPARCTVETLPERNTWTADFAPQVACTCSDLNTVCHALWQARVTQATTTGLQLEFRKALGDAPEQPLQVWVVDTGETPMQCGNLNDFAVVQTATWPVGAETRTLDVILPSMTTPPADGLSQRAYLHLITDGRETPGERTWWQFNPIRVDYSCATPL